jgi:hypothetical protein
LIAIAAEFNPKEAAGPHGIFRDKSGGGSQRTLKLPRMRYFLAVCCAFAVLSVQVLYGGAMRPVFALPGYLLVGLAGALALVAIFWRNVPSPSVSCLASVFGLAGWLIWREFGSPDPWLAQVYLRLTVACLVMYLLFACVLTNPYHRLAFICVLLFAAVVQSGAAGWQFTKRNAAGQMIPWLSEQLRLWYSESNLRGHGTYLNGNHLVWFLNAAGLSALAVTCWGRWGLKTRIVCLYVALASFAGSVVTLSRGGYLGLGVGFMRLACVTKGLSPCWSWPRWWSRWVVSSLRFSNRV